jgi:hypothetical protein
VYDPSRDRRAQELDKAAHACLMRVQQAAGQRGRAFDVYEEIRHRFAARLSADARSCAG